VGTFTYVTTNEKNIEYFHHQMPFMPISIHQMLFIFGVLHSFLANLMNHLEFLYFMLMFFVVVLGVTTVLVL
jgi:hypothetical protein